MLFSTLRSGKIYLQRTKLFSFSITSHKDKIFRCLLSCYFWPTAKSKLLQGCVTVPTERSITGPSQVTLLSSAVLPHCNFLDSRTTFFSCCGQWAGPREAELNASNLAQGRQVEWVGRGVWSGHTTWWSHKRAGDIFYVSDSEILEVL